MQETALIMQITAGKEGEQELITMPRGEKNVRCFKGTETPRSNVFKTSLKFIKQNLEEKIYRKQVGSVGMTHHQSFWHKELPSVLPN